MNLKSKFNEIIEVYESYKKLQDPKLLLNIAIQLHIIYQNLEKIFGKEFKNAKKLNGEKYVETYKYIDTLVKVHKSSSVEFIRKNSYVMGIKDFQLTIIKKQDIANALKITHDCIVHAQRVVNLHVGIH